MRVTVDTNFLISATQWDYSVAHKLLINFIEKDVKIYSTKEILNEFSEVLIRDFNYDKADARSIIEKVLAFAILIEPKNKLDIIKEDLDDNVIIECGVESNSAYIITYDKHLLNLKEYLGIKIITPEIARNIVS